MAVERRLLIIRRLVIAGLLAAFAIAPGLWLQHPFFGPFPAVDFLPALGPPFDGIWLAILVLGLLPLLHPRPPWQWIAAWTALLLARCIWDRATWQPYLLQYGTMLAVLAWTERGRAKGSSRVAGDERENEALDAMRLILIAIYFWSGVSKFNANFLYHGMTWLTADLLGASLAEVMQRFALAVPVVETGFAIALLSPRLRRAAVVAAAGMHLFILAAIGPLGSDYNVIVWPWNLVMLGLLWLLFWGEQQASPASILRPRGDPMRRLVFTLFVVCPALGQVGLWNHYLSFPLYSNAVTDGRAYISARVQVLLPESAQASVKPWKDEQIVGYLPLPYWMERELHAFIPPHRDNFVQTTRKLCKLAVEDRDIVLVVTEPPPPWKLLGEQEMWTCRELP